VTVSEPDNDSSTPSVQEKLDGTTKKIEDAIDTVKEKVSEKIGR
jgi:hypothetical protein